jgi:two-component system alkaline phosphatase synthesis response regulator PhoP
MAKRILVVDDSPDVVKIIQNTLHENGYETLAATNGEEALKIAMAEKPDLIFLDLVLPRIDGWRVCQKLKTDSLYKHIPIVMLSGLIDEEYGKQEIESGDAFLGKPIDSQKLIATVKTLLKEA